MQEVNRSTKTMLAQKLDPQHAGFNTNGVMQDWSGLAELMNIEPEVSEDLPKEFQSGDEVPGSF